MKGKKIIAAFWPIVLLFFIETVLLFTAVDITPYFFSLLFFSSFVFGWIHIILHETGHLIFGWATGYRFLSYRIFSLVIVKERGKLTFTRQAVNEAIAQCLMVPNNKWDPTNYPYKGYLSGGVVFNILFSLGALFLFIQVSFPVIQSIIFSGIGLFLAFSNGVPKGMNDGAILKKCNNNIEYQKMMYHQLRTVYYLTEGKRLNDLPPESFELSSTVPLKDSFSLYVMHLEYYKYLENFQFDEAATVLAKQWQIKEELPLMDRIMLEAELLFCFSIQRPSSEKAQNWYQKKEIQGIQKYENITFKRIFATYYLFIEHNPAKALIWTKAGLNLAHSNTVDNSLQVELNLLEWLQHQAQEKMDQQIANKIY